MRDRFFNRLYELHDRDIFIISADCGCSALDRWRETDRFINVGIAEENAIAVAAGLALEGKRPFVYGIIPFVTLRCLEFIKCEMSLMQLPITIVGIGSGFSYSDSGPTHHALEDISVMSSLPHITILNPCDKRSAEVLARRYETPTYIRLDRSAPERVEITSISDEDIVIVSTGVAVDTAVKVARDFRGVGVVQVMRLPPQDSLSLLSYLDKAKLIITFEENFNTLGKVMAWILAEYGINKNLICIHVDDYLYKYGRREEIWDGEAKLRALLTQYRS